MNRFKSTIFIIGLSLQILVQALSLWSIYHMREVNELERLSAEIHFKTNVIQDYIQAAVASKRAYLLTNKPSFLDEYKTQLILINKAIDEITKSVSKEQLKPILEVQNLMDQYRRDFEDLLYDLQHAKRHEDTQTLVIANVESGDKLSVSINNKLFALQESVRQTTIEHHTFISQQFTRMVSSIAIGSLISLLVFIFFSYSVNKEISRREREKKELQQAKLEALEASLLKSKFLATVSHEVRTPLNGIIGMSELLLTSPLPQEGRKLVEVIKKSGNSLLKMINDILDYSKIEAGAMKLSPHKFQLLDVINQVTLMMVPQTIKKKIDFITNLDPGLPAEIEGDSELLTQVLLNLVGNSIKFTSSGRINLSVNRKHLNTKHNNVVVEFIIEDTGPGIPEAIKQSLFKPFIQGQSVGTSGEPGTGLGLAISKSIIEAMGGTIFVLSEVGRGSTFSFEVPFHRISSETIGNSKPDHLMGGESFHERESMSLPFNEKVKVLVVEDNFINQMAAQMMLAKLGVESFVAHDGQEAVNLVKTNEYDLILMDCQMPVMDGFQATREIRVFNERIPIIAITANASKEDELNCLSSGMNGYISKPFSIKDLNNQLLKFLDHAKIRAIDWNILKKLKDQIGSEATGKVVQAFLSMLPALLESVEDYNALKLSFEQLRRVGHKYKSSSLTVGAMKLAFFCERLEGAESMDAMKPILVALKESIDELQKLNFSSDGVTLLN